MFSDKKNIQQLAALMEAHGIKDIVVCPGSRNAAMVHTFSQMEHMRCYAITDERCAGFYALGMALSTGLPTAVCVTSGSAVANIHPAVCEAYYQHVPLVVLSADRPQAWIGQMDGQTMPQPGVFGEMVRKSVSLPIVHTTEDEWYCNRLINEALLESTHRSGGPVHINVPVDEPFYEFHAERLPMARKIERIEGITPANTRLMGSLMEGMTKRMIVIGQKVPDQSLHKPFLNELEKGFVSLAENLANLGERHVALGDVERRVRHIPKEEEENYRPHLVITLGGTLVSKALKQFLRRNPPIMHWHVSPDGEVADVFGCLTHVIEAKPYDFMEVLGYLMMRFENDGTYNTLWSNLDVGNDCEKTDPIGLLMAHLPANAVLHLANSSAVRRAQRYPLPGSVTVCCNRGINGIEGSTSTAAGYAMACKERPNYLVTGDLSFFYDQNALWNQSLPENLHILLLNNDGGGIFDSLPLPNDAESRRLICGSHHTEARPACEQHHVRYLQGVENMEEFVEARECVLLEIRENGVKG